MSEPKSNVTPILGVMAVLLAAMVGLQIYGIWGRKTAPDPAPPVIAEASVPSANAATPPPTATNNWVLAVVEKTTTAAARHPLAGATNVVFRGAAPDGSAAMIASAATPPPVTNAVSVLAGAYGVKTGSTQAGSANLVGTVFLQGKPPPPAVQPMKERMCGNAEPYEIKSRQFVVGGNSGLADVFVYIKSGTGVDGVKFDPSADKPLLDQVRCEYHPYVLGVMAGQTFTTRNSDPVLHNVNSTRAKNNQGKNFGQPTKGQKTVMSFPNPEVAIQFRCDLHPWMTAWVGVFSTPFFAVTDGEGRFAINGLPPGRYMLAAYHPKSHGVSEGIVAEIEIKDAQVTSKDFIIPVQAK